MATIPISKGPGLTLRLGEPRPFEIFFSEHMLPGTLLVFFFKRNKSNDRRFSNIRLHIETNTHNGIMEEHSLQGALRCLKIQCLP